MVPRLVVAALAYDDVMGSPGITVFHEKRYSARQRLVVLQFGSVEEADAWDRAGQPLTLSWPVPMSDATTQDEQHEGDDRQHYEDRPQHVALVPAKRRGKPRIRIG